jgi:putative flippase GtrA
MSPVSGMSPRPLGSSGDLLHLYPHLVRLARGALALYYELDHLVRELMKFGVVGSVAFIVDVGSFNLLMYSGGTGLLYDKPLTAKTISVSAAVTVAYFGNRHWTFRHRGRSGIGREYTLFFLLNGMGLAIALTCLAFSRYVLGLHGPLADNIAANVIGLSMGTAFRFWSYRRWVFPAPELTEIAAVEARAPGVPTRAA